MVARSVLLLGVLAIMNDRERFERLQDAVRYFLSVLLEDGEPCTLGERLQCIDHRECRAYRELHAALGDELPEPLA